MMMMTCAKYWKMRGLNRWWHHARLRCKILWSGCVFVDV